MVYIPHKNIKLHFGKGRIQHNSTTIQDDLIRGKNSSCEINKILAPLIRHTSST